MSSESNNRDSSEPPGQRLRAERLRQELTQEQLADKSGKHVNTIKHIEADQKRRTLTARGWQTVSDVAAVLGRTPEFFGYRLKRLVSHKPVTGKQREVIEAVLALPENDLSRVHQLLREWERSRETKK